MRPVAAAGVAQTKKKPLSGYQTQLAVCQKSKLLKCRPHLSVRAEYSGGPRGGGGEFVTGLLLGGAIFGTLAYVYAPQIRRTLRDENEHGFKILRHPPYYDANYDENYDENDDGGLEKTRRMLNSKIRQLNNAIDNVSFRLRRGINAAVREPLDVDHQEDTGI